MHNKVRARLALVLMAPVLLLSACGDDSPLAGIFSADKAQLMAQVTNMTGLTAEQQCQLFVMLQSRAPELVAQAETVLDSENVTCVTPEGEPI